MTTHVLRSYGNNVTQAKRSLGRERRTEQRMQKPAIMHRWTVQITKSPLRVQLVRDKGMTSDLRYKFEH